MNKQEGPGRKNGGSGMAGLDIQSNQRDITEWSSVTAPSATAKPPC